MRSPRPKSKEMLHETTLEGHCLFLADFETSKRCPPSCLCRILASHSSHSIHIKQTELDTPVKKNTYNSSVLACCLQQQELDPIALHNKSQFASSQLNNTNVVVRARKRTKTVLSSLPIKRVSSTNCSHCMNVHFITQRDKHLVAPTKVKSKHLLATQPNMSARNSLCLTPDPWQWFHRRVLIVTPKETVACFHIQKWKACTYYLATNSTALRSKTARFTKPNRCTKPTDKKY